MKRFILMMLTLLLPFGAQAVPLAQQVEAPAHLSMQWTSNSGKLTLIIDAPVIVPEVEMITCIDVVPRLFTADEIRAAAAIYLPGERITPAYEQIYASSRYNHWRFRHAANGQVVVSDYMLVRGQITGVDLNAYNSEAYASEGAGIAGLPFTQHAAHQHPMSPETALAVADTVASALAPEMRMTAWGVEEGIPISAASSGSMEAQTNIIDFPEFYVFCYTPVIDGIPQLGTFTDCANDTSMMFPFRCNRLYVAVYRDGSTAFEWQAPEDYGMRRPCSLLPFAQIVEVAQHLLPLTQADVEKRYGSRQAQVQIHRVTLSYCRLQKKDAPGEYALVPVWDFFGQYGYMKDGAFHAVTMEDEGPYHTMLTLNAIDGTVIDRGYGY